MKVVGLVSGGKDSAYAMMLALHQGHEVVALANLLPQESDPDELDSYMFQTVGYQLVEAYAACMGLPLFRRRLQGKSAKQDMQYSITEGDEVEDLFLLLAHVKEALPQVVAVTSGAIASDYQRLRVEHVCGRLDLMSLAPMWHQPQRLLMRHHLGEPLRRFAFKALTNPGVGRLGRDNVDVLPLLRRLNARYGINVCGEGGEYESLVLDCPLFKHARIVLDSSELVMVSSDPISPVGYLHPTAFHLEPKDSATMHALAAPDIREVPPDWTPTRNREGRHRCSFDLPEHGGGYEVTVSTRDGPDYVQVCCRPMIHSLMQSDFTEAETLSALRDVLAALQSELLRLGLPLSGGHALYVHLYLANMGHFAAVNSTYHKVFPAVDPPSRACVQVPLPRGCPLLLDVLLARPPAVPPPLPSWARRSVLHVQSISDWAPSCIGPYSQANQYRGLVYLAGQIPLQPSSMALLPGDVAAQTRRALVSSEAVSVAVHTSTLHASLGLTLYVAAAAGTQGAIEALEVLEAALDSGSIGDVGSEQVPAFAGAGGDDVAEVGGGAGQPDPYLHLAPGVIEAALKPHITVVMVGALPRGSLVEIQPVLVDVAFMDGERRSSSSSGGDSNEEEQRQREQQQQQQGRGGGAWTRDLGGSGTQAGLGLLRVAAATTAKDTAGVECGVGAVGSFCQQGGVSSSGQAVPETGLAFPHPNSSAHHQRIRSESSSLFCTAEEMATPATSATIPTADRTVPPSTESPSNHGQSMLPTTPATTVPDTACTAAPVAPPSGVACQQSLVSTVCHGGRLLKSLIHLPASVFEANGDLQVRLQQAVASVLASQGMQLGDIIRVMAWFDVGKVPSTFSQTANGLGAHHASTCRASGSTGGSSQDPSSTAAAAETTQAAFHITWVPALGISSSACSNCAAIIEVLAMR